MLEASNLRACVAADVALANAMVRLLAGQFRRAVRQIKDLKLRTGTQRLGAFLLRLVDETGVDGVARLPFSKATLASRLGMTPENLSRALRTLEAHGLAMEGSRVSLPDRAALEELVQIDHLIDRGDDEPPPLAA
jgi:CRP/FNR family transcriptional activator FtrB